MSKRILISGFIILIFSFLSLQAQNVNEQKYRLAESFEADGDFENALRIFSELIKDAPDSDEYFDGYVRNMKAMSKFSELLIIVKERVPKKESLEMLDLYAELNWRTGNTEEANKSWEKAISKYAKYQKTYMHISQTQINLRLFEKAVGTLLKGREQFDDARLFNDPLTKLYIAIGDYKNGTTEIINMLNIDFNLPLAQGRLFALMINKDASEYIGDELRRIADKNRENIVFQETYSWYLKTIGQTNEALNLVIRIDELKNTNGLEIINFATTASRDGDYETAIKAYKIIIERGKKNPYASSALFGFTRALEQKMNSEKQKITVKSAEEIIDSYRKIIDEFPRSGNAADSRLRLATIYSEILNDNKKAIAELEKLISEFPNSQYAVSANLELGSIYIMNDELDQAEKSFTKVKQLHRFASSEQKDLALYYTALIIYFKGDIEGATKSLSLLSLNPDTDIANDVLRKLFIINSNQEKIAALELFAKAELKEFQNNHKDALKFLKEVNILASKSMLGEIALIKAAEIELKIANYQSTRDILNELNNHYSESKQIDKRIMILADSYYLEQNYGEALKFYTELITKYPDSIYLQEARKKIRIIRKDKI